MLRKRDIGGDTPKMWAAPRVHANGRRQGEFRRGQMRDEDFEGFIEIMGEATSREKVPAASIDSYRGILPDALLDIWKNEGWCGYAKGLFWTVNPSDFNGLVQMWLRGTPFETADKYHVFARDAFGVLYAWGQHYNRRVTIACADAHIIAQHDLITVPVDNPNRMLLGFFGMSERDDYDMEDDDDGEWLFDRAVKKLGRLGSGQVYGFEPALAAGGRAQLSKLRRLRMEVHLAILREFAEPTMPFQHVKLPEE
jgi:hypothetical protein